MDFHDENSGLRVWSLQLGGNHGQRSGLRQDVRDKTSAIKIRDQRDQRIASVRVKI